MVEFGGQDGCEAAVGSVGGQDGRETVVVAHEAASWSSPPPPQLQPPQSPLLLPRPQPLKQGWADATGN